MNPAPVLCVGNCRPDQAALAGLLDQHFNVSIQTADSADAACAAAEETEFALILVNRVLDADRSSGIELVGRLRTVCAGVPIMLISNYADAQEAAQAAGAAPGFGKGGLHDAATIKQLAAFLPRRN